METIFLLSKAYIDGDEVLNKIEKMAQNQNLNYVYDDHDIFVATDEFEDYIKFGGLFLEYFNETLQGKNFIDGYGCEMNIFYKSGSTILLPFLKVFLREYPDMLVYNETAGKATESNPFIYTKAHIDNFDGTDYYDLISNPPQENIT